MVVNYNRDGSSAADRCVAAAPRRSTNAGRWTIRYGMCTRVDRKVLFWKVQGRGAESESEPESESFGVVAMSQESESGSESTKLPRLRLRNVLFDSVI